MKIKGVMVKNFKGLDSVSVSFEDGAPILYIVGKNGSGKTSLLDAIYSALRGKTEGVLKKDYANLLHEKRKGSKSETKITFYDAELGTDIVVTREFTASSDTVKVETIDGKPLDKNYAVKLVSECSYDVRSFLNKTAKEQAAVFNIDTSEYDLKIKAAKEILSDANKDKLRLSKVVQNYGGKVEEVQPVFVTELIKKRDEIKRFNEEQKDIEQDLADAKEAISAIEKKIKELEVNLAAKKEKLAELPEPEEQKDLTGVNEQIKNSDEQNKKANHYKSYQKDIAAAEEAKKAWDIASEKVKDAESEKTNYLQTLDLPFSNIAIDENGGLLIDGRGLNENEWNTADAIKKAIAILKTTGQQLFFVKNGGDFDRKEDGSIPLFEQLSEENIQFIIEYVSPEKPQAKSLFLKNGNTII